MLVRVFVNKEVYDSLKGGNEVIPINPEDNVGAEEFSPYGALKDISGFNSFFFGIKNGNTTNTHANMLCKMSSEENVHGLILDVPEEETFSMDYYTFSDMIYYSECEEDPKTVLRCKTLIENKEYSKEDVIQVIFKRIKPEYIVGTI